MTQRLKRHRPSLRRQLLLGILVPTVAVVALNTVMLYRQALAAADTAYDRTLLATAKSLGEQLALVTAADDGAPLALPPRSKFDTALTAIEPPREAPGLALADVDGRPLSLDEFRGEVVLLSFWATWCPPCVEELPSMNRLRARLYERGLRVVGVDVGETAAQMRAFLKRVDVAFPNLLDVEASAAARWNVHAFPTSFVIDRDGRIRYGIVGALDWERAENMGPIEALLDKSVGNEKPR